MQPSPYTPGEVARNVPGRAVQLAEFDERLSYLVDLGRLIGRIRVDHAPRGLGKTSLLRQYQQRAELRGVFTIWVTAGEGSSLVAQLLAEIERTAPKRRGDAARELAARISEVQLSVGVPGVVSVGASLRAAAPPHDAVRGLEAVVRSVATGTRGFVIFVDELQEADAEGIRILAYAWQHLQAEGAGVPAAVFAAGLPNTPDVVSAVVTFSERFAFRAVGPLEREAEELALRVPAKALGVEWAPGALDAAIETASGYPYLVQLIGEAAWVEAGRPDAGGVVELGHVIAARGRLRADLEALFRARWANSTPAEQALMRAMAGLGSGPVSRARVAEALGVTTASLSVLRSRLIDKGFIATVSRGTLEFTIPGFAEFIASLAE